MEWIKYSVFCILESVPAHQTKVTCVIQATSKYANGRRDVKRWNLSWASACNYTHAKQNKTTNNNDIAEDISKRAYSQICPRCHGTAHTILALHFTCCQQFCLSNFCRPGPLNFLSQFSVDVQWRVTQTADWVLSMKTHQSVDICLSLSVDALQVFCLFLLLPLIIIIITHFQTRSPFSLASKATLSGFCIPVTTSITLQVTTLRWPRCRLPRCKSPRCRGLRRRWPGDNVVGDHHVGNHVVGDHDVGDQVTTLQITTL